MKKSKYTILIPNGERFIAYNTINGSFLHIGNGMADSVDFFYDKLSDNQKKILFEKHFAVKDLDDEQQFLLNTYTEQKVGLTATLFITIEFTGLCNFSCGFCYQSEWEKRSCISNDNIEHLFKMLENSNLESYSDLNVDFIGGEPLLYSNKVMDVYNRFKSFCDNKGMNLSIKLNTNGYHLTRQIIDRLNNTEIILPFLSSKDYDNIVKSKTGVVNLYEFMKGKISSWVDALNENQNNHLVFRFNANHQNISLFDEYIKEILSFGIKKINLSIVNTYNTSGATFYNKLSDKDFFSWYLKVVLPLCHENNIKFPIRPRNALSRCKGRRPGSFKLFADGRLGLCNGIEYDSAAPMISDCKSLDDIDKVYGFIKEYHYLHDNTCCNCNMVFLCGGKSPCTYGQCNRSQENIIRYVKVKSDLLRNK